MAKINGNEIRPGNVVNHQDRLWVAAKVDHVKPGKGGAYAQVELAKDFVGERAAFLQDGMKITLEMHEETPLGVKFPANVILEVTEVDPVQKGQSVSSQFKPAIMSNGLKVMVPPFIAVGERIVVDTTEATYMRRAD
jgi:elongation factor P